MTTKEAELLAKFDEAIELAEEALELAQESKLKEAETATKYINLKLVQANDNL